MIYRYKKILKEFLNFKNKNKDTDEYEYYLCIPHSPKNNELEYYGEQVYYRLQKPRYPVIKKFNYYLDFFDSQLEYENNEHYTMYIINNISIIYKLNNFIKDQFKNKDIDLSEDGIKIYKPFLLVINKNNKNEIKILFKKLSIIKNIMKNDIYYMDTGKKEYQTIINDFKIK